MRYFTSDQLTLLNSPNLKARLLVAFYLDEGTYRFCDDVLDISDGTNTWIGASALISDIEYTSGSDLAAEPITLVCDGNRMAQAGIHDPARVLSDMLGFINRQRRVDYFIAFSTPEDEIVNIIIPVAAMKINYAQLVDAKIDFTSSGDITSQLRITMDSLAARYTSASFRVRSHQDQIEIDPTDQFFSLTANAVRTAPTLYWGKATPAGVSSTPYQGPWFRYQQAIY